tara:strand:- start:867 stop:2180 length:1314 start_codon:yes stop_codon:yes gene_type:complete
MQTVGYFLHGKKHGKNYKDEYIQILKNYCYLNDHTEVETYVDNSLTRLSIFSEFEKLRKDIKSNNKKYLIVIKNSSDLGRSIEEIIENLIWFEDYKCKVLCVDEENPDPYQDTVRRYIYNDNENLQWSSFVSTKMKNKFATGKWMGRLPFGYDINSNGYLTINMKESRIVKEIFDLYVKQEFGIRKITKILNEKKYKTKKNNLWNISTVYDLIKNPVYIGTSKRFGVSIPNAHSNIILNNIYMEAQNKLYLRRPVRTSIDVENYLLSGILYCSLCDSKMIGVTKKIKYVNNANLNKNRYRYYKCSKKQNSGHCESNSISAENFEKEFISKFDKELLTQRVNYKKKFPKILNKIKLKRNNAVINARKLFKDALINTSKGKIGVDVLKLYLIHYKKIQESVKYEININSILTKDELKLNFINKVYVHNNGYKIHYERAS